MPQSLSNVVIHLIFSTKDRRQLIIKEVQPELNKYIATILKSLDCPAVTIESMPDHVHILFNLSRSQSVSRVVEEVKKRSSKWIKTKGPNFMVFSWQRGYGAFSVSTISRFQRLICGGDIFPGALPQAVLIRAFGASKR